MLAEGPAKEGTGIRRPRYLLLADDLREEIARGDYRGATPFPTESALCTRFGVSRFTVREALRALQAERLIERRRGSGTVVRASATGADRVHTEISNLREILFYAQNTRFAFSLTAERKLPRRLADLDPDAAQARWIGFSGVRHVEGWDTPLAITEGYIHADLRHATAGLEQKDMAIFRQLELLAGVKIVSIRQDVQAVSAGRRIAAGLGLTTVRAPCLRIVRRYADAAGRVLVISESWHPGDRFALGMQLDVPD